MKVHSAAGTGEAHTEAPPFHPAPVENMLRHVVKAVRAHQLYLHNNPVYIKAIELLKASFAPIWTQTDEIDLSVSETDFRWYGSPVLVEPERSSDSLPWTFYKDGIRELKFIKGFEQEEVVTLLDLLQRSRNAPPEEDDLLTLLWQAEFLSLRYRFVDLGVESAPPVDADVVGTEQPRTLAEPVQVEDERPQAGVVNIDEFDSTLYFLDENEIEYLKTAVRREYESDLRINVLALLFDIFETQTDPVIRDEIVGIMDNFVLHLLSASQFAAVAYMLREATIASERAAEITPEQQKRLATLPDRLSAPAALSQMLQALDESAELPPGEELNELFVQLRPSALGTAFEFLTKLQNPRLKALLEQAADRLAGANTAELVNLIGSRNEVVASEAVRRAGALRTQAAVAALGKALVEGSPALRLLCVQALSDVGSPGALLVLERGLEDPDRDVRVNTVRAVATRSYKAALPRLEEVIRGKALRERDLTEKMAMFEAYGSLCGDAGVEGLDAILNARSGLLSRKVDPELRACAAMALGRIGTRRAIDSLRRAAGEKDIVVRNAVNRAMRGERT